MHQDEFDREIASCVLDNIVNPLVDVGERVAKLMRALNETPTWLDPEPEADAET